jgi:hypothetical protein
VLPKVTSRVKQAKTLQPATMRGFNGGLNVVDDDMNLSANYSTRALNVFMGSDGVARVRYGTKLFSKNTAVGLINLEYYNTAIIGVLSNGDIVRITGNGARTTLFTGWNTTDFASFAQFNGKLIICNGSDKPLEVNQNFLVDYLQDLGTGTNINVPVCKYVIACGRYLVMAGDPLNPTTVHISAKDAAGTWFGDPPPNDATRVQVGSLLSSGVTIRGLLQFRGKLLVLYAEGIVVNTLGIYDADGNHTPTLGDDVIEQYGSVSHRVAIARGDDGLFMDLEGVPSISRTLLSNAFKPERASLLVDPLITAKLASLSFATLEDRVFAVYDHKEGQYMLFIPNADAIGDTTETHVFTYSYRSVLKQDNWSEWGGWNFTCGCRSLQGNIFFGDANGDIWLMGSRDNPVHADYVDLVSVPPDNDPEGVAITFDWELPWMDFRNRTQVKNSKYIGFDTRGYGEFTCSMYVDNITSAPTLSTLFSGGEQGAFGDGDQPYGGGRNTSYKKLYAWPAKFEIAKFRFQGSIREPLAFVSISLQYQLGGNRP